MSIDRLLFDDNETPRPPAPGGWTEEQLDLMMFERDQLIAMLRYKERVLYKAGRIRRYSLPARPAK